MPQRAGTAKGIESGSEPQTACLVPASSVVMQVNKCMPVRHCKEKKPNGMKGSLSPYWHLFKILHASLCHFVSLCAPSIPSYWHLLMITACKAFANHHQPAFEAPRVSSRSAAEGIHFHLVAASQ